MNLDEIESFSEIDTTNVLDVLLKFPDQIMQSEAVVTESHIPRLYDIDHILITGAGENETAGSLIKTYLQERSSLPITVIHSGNLPKWVNKHTLVFPLSYEGECFETISSFKEAIKNHCKIIGMTSNGHLKQYCVHRDLPFVDLPQDIPSRFTLGLLFFSTIFSLQKTGLIKLNIDSDVDETGIMLQKLKETFEPIVPIKDNPAKQLGMRLHHRIPLIYGWGVYAPVAKRWAMQCNLNAKLISQYYQVPDCTYYALVGWANQQQSMQQYTSIIFRDHQLETKEMKKRLHFLERFFKEIFADQISVNPTGKSDLTKIFSLLYLGDFMSVYASIHADINPIQTPIIHQLKEEIAYP